MQHIDYIILGAGIAGLAAGQKLHDMGKDFLILEKDSTYGGLCGNFTVPSSVGDFLFDKFIHLSFTNSETVRKFFDKTEYVTHIPNPVNYYHGTWIKHPAQNNLFPLSDEEKQKILADLKKREKYKNDFEKNYEMWLRYQFGDYFAENFPLVYTEKYWGVHAHELETKWVGIRVYQPTLQEIEQGMKTCETPVTYYAKEMRYPNTGRGYKSFLENFVYESNIRYNEKVVRIDIENKIVYTVKNSYRYNNLVSSLPLPEYKNFIPMPRKIENAINNLHWTSGYIVSLGMIGELLHENLWYYIYDKEILPARIYSASKKSSRNVPYGYCSLQAEIYFKHNNISKENKADILQDVINQLAASTIIDKQRIVASDIRFEKYANVIFDHKIYEMRKIVRDYLALKGLTTIGRFGEWDYLWSDQSFLSGYSKNIFL